MIQENNIVFTSQEVTIKDSIKIQKIITIVMCISFLIYSGGAFKTALYSEGIVSIIFHGLLLLIWIICFIALIFKRSYKSAYSYDEIKTVKLKLSDNAIKAVFLLKNSRQRKITIDTTDNAYGKLIENLKSTPLTIQETHSDKQQTQSHKSPDLQENYRR